MATTSSTTGSSASAAPGDELGGRYQLLRGIGSGGSATVFEAIDLSLERRVAVKVLHRKLSSDGNFLERFRKEARSAASLSHPNVLAVHDWGEDDVPFLVMELLSGGSMRSMLDTGAVLTPSQAISVGLDACRGLHYAHSQDLVHRDVTPANLIFGSESRLRVADFGLARAFAESGWTEPGKDLVGTARYASPEQAQGLRLDASSDVYSLGLVLVEALSGSVPFSADTMLGTLTARVESDVPIPDVPERLADVLRSMTQRDPAARPTSVEAGGALLKAAEGMPRPKRLPLTGLPEETSTDPIGDGPANPADDLTVHDTPDATQIAGTPVVAVESEEQVRRWPWLLLSLIAIAAAGWFAVTQIGAGGLTSSAVPDVVGLARDDALAQLGSTWELEEKLDRVVDVPAGQIVRTDPPAGTSLEEGQVLNYWVSLGLPLIRVPEAELIGRSFEQAEATLDAALLTVGEVDRVNSEDVGAGLVISIEADALELPQGDPVNLIVSLGPQLRQIPEVGPGANAEDYIATLEASGLGVVRSVEFNDDVPLGQFVLIDPPPGSSVARGSQVTVIISDGPVPVPVPSTSGLDLGDALDRLDAVGLLAGDLLGSGNARCAVIGTEPPAGTELQPGTAVSIFLSDCG